MLILQRGMTSPGAAPTTAKAKVIITLSWEQLVGDLRGLGTTLTGEQLTPHIRRLACDADLLPMVLGSRGEVLDLGQAFRLASPAQKLVLWAEQKHCTYQGCSMPAPWCDAHHEVWWSAAGSPTTTTSTSSAPATMQGSTIVTCNPSRARSPVTSTGTTD